MQEKRQPQYPLFKFKTAVRDGRVMFPGRVDAHLRSCGWARSDIIGCLLSLRGEDFYKSQIHRTRAGVWLDIYKPVCLGERLYVKLTLHEDKARFIVLSFCRDGEEH